MDAFIADAIADALDAPVPTVIHNADRVAEMRARQSAERAAKNAAMVPTVRAIGTDDGLNAVDRNEATFAAMAVK